MGNNKKQELQTRRDFFKKTAKKVLPIIGSIGILNIPFIAKAESPMLVTVCGIDRLARAVQFLNASSSIATTV